MRIGIPKEVKDQEYRISVTPAMVKELIDAGHEVKLQKGAGAAVGYLDEQFIRVGARMASTAEEVWDSDMILKVKEPIQSEFHLMKEGQILFCFLHLAACPDLVDALLKQKVIAIAYETVTDEIGRLPLLLPMSEIAGRVSVQVGAACLQMASGGKGILLGGVPGVRPGKVVILGGGIVGTEAARMAVGLGADVTIMDINLSRLKKLEMQYAPRLKTLFSSTFDVSEVLCDADLIVGSVLIPGKSAPKLITRSMIQQMTPGSVFVDVSIDQGGCSETSKPTTHSEPTYTVDGVVHYCVTNMPAACSRTATQALTHATIGHTLALANLGAKEALLSNPHLAEGLNISNGVVTNKSVAQDLGYEYHEPNEVLK